MIRSRRHGSCIAKSLGRLDFRDIRTKIIKVYRTKLSKGNDL